MSKEPKRNVYVGHRYVPKIMGEWDKAETYEGLSIVTNKGTSYTSKKRVPKGIDILNEEYWVVTGNYNAQIEEYRKDVRELEKEVDKKADIDYVDDEIDSVLSKLDISLKDEFNLEEYSHLIPNKSTSIRDHWDWTIPMQEALNRTGVIKFPEGIINIHADLIGSDNTILRGKGIGKTILKFHQEDGEIIRLKLGDFSTKIKNFFIFDIEIDGGVYTPTHNVSTVHFKRATNVGVYNSKIYNADDACIRIDGYGETFKDSAWNPADPDHETLWKQSSHFVFYNNDISNGYLGIEVEGGASKGLIEKNRISNVTKHGIRLPSGWDIDVISNIIEHCDTAIYIDRSWTINVAWNKIEHIRKNAIPVGNFTGGSIMFNSGKNISGVFLTDNYFDTAPLYVNNVTIMGNHSDKSISLYETNNCIVVNNHAPLNVMRPDNKNLLVDGNIGNMDYSSSLEENASHNGGNVRVLTHYKENGDIQKTGSGDILGELNSLKGRRSSPPTKGRWERGDFIINRSKSKMGYTQNISLGWINTTDGDFNETPPEFIPLGDYDGTLGFPHSRTTDNANNQNFVNQSLPNGLSQIELNMIAYSSDYSVHGSWKIIVTAVRKGDVVTLLDSTNLLEVTNQPLSVGVIASGNSVKFTVKGLTDTEIHWNGSFRFMNEVLPS